MTTCCDLPLSAETSLQQRRHLDYAIQSAREASMSFDPARYFDAAPEYMVERGKALALVNMLSKCHRT
jgi:hypothetical protein